jgi:hypothetical protein
MQQKHPHSKSSPRRDLLILLAGVVAVLLIGAPQVYHEYLLAQHSQEVVATVVSKNSGHGWVEYEYVVDGKAYGGSIPATSTGRGFDEVHVGDKVTVQFDPTNPAVSGTAETRSAISSTGPLALFAVVLLTVLAYSTNYLIDVHRGVIVDVEATTAYRTSEVNSTKTMIERVEQRFALKPKRLIGDTAYGTAQILGWLLRQTWRRSSSQLPHRLRWPNCYRRSICFWQKGRFLIARSRRRSTPACPV